MVDLKRLGRSFTETAAGFTDVKLFGGERISEDVLENREQIIENLKAAKERKRMREQQTQDLKNRIIYHEGGTFHTFYKDSLGNLTTGAGLLLNKALKKKLNKDQLTNNAFISPKLVDEEFEARFKGAQDAAVKFIGGRDNFNKLSNIRQGVLIEMAYQLGETKLNKFVKMKTNLGNFIKSGSNSDLISVVEEMFDSQWYDQSGERAVNLMHSFVGNDHYIQNNIKDSDGLRAKRDEKQEKANESDIANINDLRGPLKTELIFNYNKEDYIKNLPSLITQSMPRKRRKKKSGVSKTGSKIKPVTDEELKAARERIAKNELKNKRIKQGQELQGNLKANDLSISKGGSSKPSGMLIPSNVDEIQDVTGVTDFSQGFPRVI